MGGRKKSNARASIRGAAGAMTSGCIGSAVLTPISAATNALAPLQSHAHAAWTQQSVLPVSPCVPWCVGWEVTVVPAEGADPG